MKTVKPAICLICLVVAALALKWTDGYHSLYGAAQLILLASIALVLHSRKRNPRKAVRSKDPSFFSSIVSGLKISGLLIGTMWAGFAVLSLVGAPNPFEDSGRIELRLRLRGLEQRQAYGEAIRLIDQQLPQVSSEAWKAELRSQLYEYLVTAANATADSEDAINCLNRAKEQATTEHESLLANLLLSQATQRELFKAAEAACRKGGEWAKLATLLTAVCELRLEHQWDGDARQELFCTLVEQGRSAASLDDADAAFLEAHAVAQRFDLDGRTAASLADEISLLRDLKSGGRFQDLIVLLKQRANRFPASQSAGMLYDALVQHAAAAGKLEDRLALYREAVELAQEHNLDSQVAARELEYVLAKVGDRATFLERVEDLRSQEKFADLIRLLQQRIDCRPKAEWGFPLVQWQLEAYCRLADHTGIQDRIRLCRTAMQLASQHDLDTSDIESRLVAAEKELRRQNAFLAKLEELKEQQRFTELLSVLKVHAESPRDEWLCSADKAIYQTLLQWGDAADGLSEKLSRYKQAVEAAGRFSLDGKDAEEKRQRVKAEIDRLARLAAERSRPRDLPSGTKAALLRVSTDLYPPSLMADIQVVDNGRIAIKDLQRKDFGVTLGGNRVDDVALAPIEQKPIPLSVLICLDTSGSTTRSLPVAVDGTKQLINRLAMVNESVKLASFNSKTETASAWTTNKDSLRRGLDLLKSGGETALFVTVTWAAAELAKRPGDRCLVVFTDGRNTVGGASLTETVAACQRANVCVHAIGLRTGDLDSNSLSTLASETGGRYVEASSPSELSTLLADTSSRVRQHYYRLVLTPKASHGPINRDSVLGIRVGGKNGIQLSEPCGMPSVADTSVQSR